MTFAIPPPGPVAPAVAAGTGSPAISTENLYEALTLTGAGFSVANTIYAGGADPAGVADSTAAFQAALDAAAAAGGAAVIVPNGTFVVGNLLIGSRVTLQGSGPATVLTSAYATLGDLIALASPASTTSASIRDLTIDAGQTSLNGIHFDNTGLAGTGGHYLSNVLVRNAGGSAFLFGATSELICSGCRATGSMGNGFFIDANVINSRFSDCGSAISGGNGFEIVGNNNSFTGCKATWSGYSLGLWGILQSGFHLNGCSYVTMSGCKAQQNALHGFSLEGADNCAVTGCNADTNSAGTNGGVGINLLNATNCPIAGNTGGNSTLTPGSQAYGVQINGSQNGTIIIGNAITGTSGPLHFAGGSGSISLYSVGATWHFSALGNVQLDFGALAVAFPGFGIKIAEGNGTNAKQGTAVLNGTTAVVISNAAAHTTSRIFLTINVPGGTVGSPYVSAVVDGTSFSIKSTAVGDTSTVAYLITEPA